MIYLLLSVLCSTCLLLVFKFIEPRGISKLQVITVNYFVAALMGIFTTPPGVSFSAIPSQDWFPPALMLGSLFICVFYCVGASTQLSGVAVTSVAFKLSLVIPVVAAYFLYGDSFGAMKVAGIALALAAIVLTSKGKPSGSAKTAPGFAAVLPFIVFFGSGICDLFFNFIQNRYLGEQDFSTFLVILFFTAGAGGSLALLYALLRKKTSLQPKALLAGIALGIPNYGSAYFMIRALHGSGMEASDLWTLNNIGIILASTAAAAIFFQERINRFGAAGIAIAIASIVLIAFSS